MNNKHRTTVKAVILVVMAVCLLPIGQAYYQSWQHREQLSRLRDMVAKTEVQFPAVVESAPQDTAVSVLEAQAVSEAAYDGGTDGQTSPTSEEDGAQKEESASKQDAVLEKYTQLHAENSDLAGWITIEGMKIDYPVMCNADDNYYLHHDFYGEESKYGCLYVKAQADLDAGTNFIIYGHNMKDGSMFGDLDLYLKESFYKEHSTISFDTLYEERAYEIVAVFRSQVYNTDEDVFKYYQFYQADTQAEFEDFYNNIKDLALYDTGVMAQFGDTFLTLSTCAYHVQDGRLVVVAKRVA